MVHWKIIIKRVWRRIKYVFDSGLLYWEYESCERCGHCFKLNWSAVDSAWIDVVGSDGGCLCIDCFVEIAREKGIKLGSVDIERMEIFNPEE